MNRPDDTRSGVMDALHHGEPVAEKAAAWPEVPDLGVRRLTDVELDERIRSGWDVWCALLDELLTTGGMLPSPQLAARAVEFFEDIYWRAEDARIEALRRELDRLVAKTELPRIRYHDLRHTHATLLLQAGVPPHVVSMRLGHRSVAFTLEQYAHVLPQQQADAVERLASRLWRKS